PRSILLLYLTCPRCCSAVALARPVLHRLRFLFFFNDPAPPEIYTLSLHDALPIASPRSGGVEGANGTDGFFGAVPAEAHSGRRKPDQARMAEDLSDTPAIAAWRHLRHQLGHRHEGKRDRGLLGWNGVARSRRQLLSAGLDPQSL